MIHEIGVEDVQQARATNERLIILDVLAPESYEHRHLPGAVNAPLADPDFETRVREIVPDPSTPVVVYCGSESCTASTKASQRLLALGYRDIREFTGGLDAWRQAGLPFEGRMYEAADRSDANEQPA